MTVQVPYNAIAETVDVLVETTPTGDPPPIVDPTQQYLGNWSSPTSANQFTYWAPPTILSVSPAAGPLVGGNQIVIEGYNLLGVTNANSSVDFDADNPGTIDGVVQFLDTSPPIYQMIVTVPPSPGGGPGLVFVILTTPGGSEFDDDAYNYLPPPTFDSLAVGLGGGTGSFGAWGPAGVQTSVTITGSNLGTVTAVDFGSVAGIDFNVNAAGTQITVETPDGVSGPAEVSLVSVAAPGGSLDTGEKFYFEQSPVVTGISPAVLNAAGNTEVTITGTSLYPVINGLEFINAQNPLQQSQALSIVTASSTPTQIVAYAPGGSTQAGNFDWVIVQTPFGNSPETASAKVTFANNPPAITSLLVVGSGPVIGATVDIFGSNLYGVGAVYFTNYQGIPVLATNLTYISETQIQADIPPVFPGTYSVAVSNGVLSNALDLTVVASPIITGVSPPAGITSPGIPVTITGENIMPFLGDVYFGGIRVVPTSSSSTEVQVVSPSVPAADAGETVDITILTLNGTTAIVPADEFTYLTVSQAVTGVSPASGLTAGGTLVTITGNYLNNATSVTFGGVSAAILPGTDTGTSLEVTSPAWTGSTSSPVSVAVTGEYGTTPPSSAAEFTYYTPAPVVGGLSPATGIAAGGTSVTISGTALSGITAIDFGSTPANLSTLVYNSSGTVTITSPASAGGATGPVDVRVTTAGGESAITGVDEFTYGNLPNVTLLYYSVGPAYTSDALNQEIFGTNFTGATEVIYGSYIDQYTETVIPITAADIQNGGTAIGFFGLPSQPPRTVYVQVVTPVGTSAENAASEFTFTAGPLIEGGIGGEGPLTGGTSMTETGDDFEAPGDTTGADTQVYVGGALATITSISSGSVTFTTPPGSPGTVGITIVDPEGDSSVGFVPQYTYFAPPTITGVSPAEGNLAGGDAVVVTGTGLEYANIYFGGNEAGGGLYGYYYDTDAAQYVSSPAANQYGTVDVTAVSPGGTLTISLADEFTYVPPPSVTGIIPASGAVEGGTTVDIQGTDFSWTSSVTVGGVAATIVSQSDDQIQIVTPPSSGDQTGTDDILVAAYGGTSQATSADQFTYTDAPYISSVTGPITYNGSSAYGLIAGGDTVTINGDDFTGATAVNFGNTPATSFTVSSDGTYITATDPSGMTTGTVDTTVTTPLGTTDIHPNDQFTYVQAPVITSVSPATGSTNGGTQVTITGSGLALATAVQFGYNYTSPNLGTITSDTDGQIVATSPATFEGMAGTVDVTVTTPFGTSTTSPANQFTYVAPPSITSLDTTSGSVYGGTLVTISGRGLAAATEVDFGSNPATIISNTDGQIIVLSPEATGDSPGPVDVTVTNAYGTGELYPSQFTYGLPPAVTSISPASGPAAGGTSVVISGDNLTNVIAVDFGGVASPTFSANADGTITAVSPPDAPSTVDITVVTYGGPSPTTLADQFTYFPPPIVASVSPTAGPTGGGTTLTISGIGLGGATSVDFTDSQGDDYQGTIQNESGNSLVVTSPNYGVATTVDITVTTASGTSATSSADQFNYVVVPTVSSISPTAGLRAGGDTVEIYGANLAGATSVAFGGAGPIHDQRQLRLPLLRQPCGRLDHRDQSARQRRHGGRDGGHRRRVVAHLRRRPVHLSPARPRRHGREPGGRGRGGRRNGHDQRHGLGQRQRSRFQRGRGHDCPRFGHGHADHGHRSGRNARDRGRHGDHYRRHVPHDAGRSVYGRCRAGSLVDRGGHRLDVRATPTSPSPDRA